MLKLSDADVYRDCKDQLHKSYTVELGLPVIYVVGGFYITLWKGNSQKDEFFKKINNKF